jgi:hypothetical protein
MKNAVKGNDRFQNLARQNVTLAKCSNAGISRGSLQQLRNLTLSFGFSSAMGELLYLNGAFYVTHAGLVRLASRRRCAGIQTDQLDQFSDPLAGRWVFRATVFKSASSRGFVGFGDADPSNVSSIVRGAEMRVAETRAVNRALRKAYGIGLCSVEELGAFSGPPKPSANSSSSNGAGSHGANGSGKAQPRLRDQLCLLIREFELDPKRVKSYAAEFCGTEVLSEASRESIESFITHLSAEAKENRDALICKLNSYAHSVEAGS